ncbi:hypothetical protein ACSYAD_31045 [Acaryochloris marina NIES-2412]|uniref:hypothetical protein n=1 Tax=Acaryochloris marina TaxID=155978 RepID=UPI00405A16F1
MVSFHSDQKVSPLMKAKIVLCDDDGNVLPNSSSTAYDFELGGQTLDEIEQAVEQFRCQALPELEANILQSAQQQHTEDFKKQDESPSTVGSE